MGFVSRGERKRVANRWLRTFDENELEWLVTRTQQETKQAAAAAARGPVGGRRHTSTLLLLRLKIGKLAREFRDEPSRKNQRGSQAWLRDFAVAHFGVPAGGVVSKSTRVFIKRCVQLAESGHVVGAVRIGRSRSAKKTVGTMKTKACLRRRNHGTQGRPQLLPELRVALFQWFIDIRSSVCGRLMGRAVLAQAERLLEEIADAYAQHGRPPPAAPVLDKCWLWRWCREFGVNLRKPNLKYKVSRAKCKRRTRRVTINCFIARLAFTLLYGGSAACARGACNCRIGQASAGAADAPPSGCRRSRGLAAEPPMISIDQKGAYFNNAESKGGKTYHPSGSYDDRVKLKTNHAQSRMRFSLNTVMAVRCPWRVPPLGVLFKGKTPRVLHGLEVQPGLPVHVGHSASGSYNLEKFLEHLREVLPEWSEER